VESLPALEPFRALAARVERNPDVSKFVSEQRLHQAEIELAQARSRPSWRLIGGLRRIESGDDFAVVGGITVPLRLGNRNQGSIAVARADLARAEAEAVAVRVAIETELFVLYQRLRHDIQLPERLVAEVIPGFETALDDTRRAFELGRSSYLELRDVQTELLDANNELLEAYIDAHRLVIEIERLTGERIAPAPTTQ
jgi:cobalt-zinc-cadmium efflux system outer membrane protein